jgi:acyl-CoA thioesterase
MHDADTKALETATNMLAKDKFSQWLNISLIEAKAGYCRLQMVVRNDMLNGFGIAHGGCIFSFADSALAIVCNNDERITLALEANISFTKAVKENDILTAEAKELNKTKRTGLYIIEVKNQLGQLVALFKGTSYTRTSD